MRAGRGPQIRFNRCRDCLDNSGNVTDQCNYSSPSYLEWDVLTIFLESVMSRIVVASSENKDGNTTTHVSVSTPPTVISPPPDFSMGLLKDILAYDPLVSIDT